MSQVISLHFVEGGRSRADQTHLTLQNVDKLRKLVDGHLTKEASYSCDPGIILQLEHRTVHDIEGCELLLAFFGISIHRPKLEQFENAAVLSDPPLSKQHRTG